MGSLYSCFCTQRDFIEGNERLLVDSCIEHLAHDYVFASTLQPEQMVRADGAWRKQRELFTRAGVDLPVLPAYMQPALVSAEAAQHVRRLLSDLTTGQLTVVHHGACACFQSVTLGILLARGEVTGTEARKSLAVAFQEIPIRALKGFIKFAKLSKAS